MNEKFEKYKKFGLIGLIALTGLVISPVIFLAIKGLIGLIIASAIGLAVVSFSPYIAMKFANWKVAAIKKEAGENPIETMENLLAAKQRAFQEFRNNVTQSIAARDTFRDKCREFGRKYPARAAEFQTQLERMTKLVDQKQTALKEAAVQLELGEHKLTEMRAYWDMSQTAIKLNKAAGMDTGDLYERLKADTAVDAVFTSMNTAFAELEVAASLSDYDTPALENNVVMPLTIDMKQTQRVA